MCSMALALCLTSATEVPAQVLVTPSPTPVIVFSPIAVPGPVCTCKPRLPARSDVVLLWNETILNAIRAGRTPPPLAARNLAIVHAAIYDSVNAIQQTHRPYYIQMQAPPGALPRVAAAVAAHRSLLTLYPKQAKQFDAALDQSLAGITPGQAMQGSIQLGQNVAEKVLAWRQNDGSTARVTYKPRGQGYWRPTLPNYQSALLPQWPKVRCFCMRTVTQFRPANPPPVGSDQYWKNYREVKALGGVRSSVRSKDQTQIAWFWADDVGSVTPPGHWNQIAQTVARSRRTTLAQNARLFVLLNLALADAGILAWDCKYHHDYWRPIQGIRAAKVTENADTSGDPQWTPLLPTPPFPTYTSGHSTFSGAAAAVLANFFGTDQIRFTSTSDALPGVTRTYTSFSQAANEAGRSRIYGGIHWEFDNSEGLSSSRALGNYVSRYFLIPRTRNAAK